MGVCVGVWSGVRKGGGAPAAMSWNIAAVNQSGCLTNPCAQYVLDAGRNRNSSNCMRHQSDRNGYST